MLSLLALLVNKILCQWTLVTKWKVGVYLSWGVVSDISYMTGPSYPTKIPHQDRGRLDRGTIFSHHGYHHYLA